ncbi:MAG: hypothetical protein RI947_285 [Candidatus Parcubacteria bacterium]|jgi:uncharacterized protein YpmB
MQKPQYAVYEGKEKQRLVAHIVGDAYYVAIAMTEELHETTHHELISELKQQLQSNEITHLKQLEMIIENILIDFNISEGFSLTAAVVNNQVLYIKTVGDGQVYIERDKQLARIIEGEKSASGYIQPGDLYLLTTNSFTEAVGDDTNLKQILSHKNPKKICEAMTSSLKDAVDKGTVAITLHFDGKLHMDEEIHLVDQPTSVDPMDETAVNEDQVESIVSKPSLKERVFGMFSRKPQQEQYVGEESEPQPANKKRTITIGVVVVIFIILIWSVVLGYKRRTNAENQKKILATKELITQKLNQADEVAFLNMSRSMVLFNESKEELAKLKKEIGESDDPNLISLEKMIAEREDEIVKKEDKNAEEFYDMAIENKQAKGTKMNLDGSNATILDNQNSTVYILSLEKKSLSKRTAPEIIGATITALDDETLLFYVPGKGIYKMDADEKATKIIDNDKDWGNLVGMTTYNGNIYVLDTGEQDVYKYIAAGDGYSGKSSYFKGSYPGLTSANSIAIDLSVYLGLTDKVVKFTSGLQDDFKPAFPVTDIQINKVYTSADNDKVYALDKHIGSVFVIDKDGNYQSQVKSAALSRADDFITWKGAAYVLVKDKIYKISLE